ncbi:Ribonuclease P protein subunit p21 [Kappamyces sp. JEL0680]|nr:Ribonuclease P protein subunit p21 [Kappamyces sp. JEL0680]
MGKKTKQNQIISKPVPKDAFARLSFLFQVAAFYTTHHQKSPVVPVGPSDGRGNGTNCIQSLDTQTLPETARGLDCNESPVAKDPSTSQLKYLSHGLLRQFRLTRQRLVLPVDPSMKRVICKGCDGFLVPGQTCRVEFRESLTLVVWKCLLCTREKRFPLDREKPLFSGVPLQENEQVVYLKK